MQQSDARSNPHLPIQSLLGVVHGTILGTPVVVIQHLAAGERTKPFQL